MNRLPVADTAPPETTTPVPTVVVLEVLTADPHELADSPLQPRSFYDPGHIEALASAMRRGWKPRGLRARRVGEVVQLIYGHCRKRAAIAAGLRELEVEIVEATDGEALDMIGAENLRRASLHPLDEGSLFRTRLEVLRQEQPELDPRAALVEVAALMAKPLPYVRSRMKLLDLIAPVQAALRADLPLQLASQLAGLQAADQGRALAWIQDEGRREGVPSTHALGRWIASAILCDLATVAWELHDEGLDPVAGSCAACPKRSGAQPELFPGVQQGDRCADPACFQRKTELFVAAQRSRLQADAGFDDKGQERPTLELSTSFNAWGDAKLETQPFLGVPLARDAWKPVEKKDRKKCLAPTPGLVVHGDGVGRMQDVCFERTCPVHWANEPPLKGSEEQKERRKAELAAQRLEAEVVRLTILGVSANIAQVGHDEDDLRLVARALWSGMDPSARARWAGIAEVAPKDAHEALVKTLGRRGDDTLDTVDEVLALLALCVQLALCQDVTLGGKELPGAAKRARVNAADVLATAKANLEPAKPKEKPAPKPEKAKPAKAKAKKGGAK